LRNLAEAVADEEDEVDEDAVGLALDLEVAEERVGAEEGEALVDDVRLGRVGCESASESVSRLRLRWGGGEGRCSPARPEVGEDEEAAHGVREEREDAPGVGADPLMRLEKGSSARLPTWRAPCASSFHDEW